MRNTGNVFNAPTSNNPEEPSCNTEQPMTCLFNRAHTNISLTRFREHLRGCKERIKLTQSVLEPEERVKNARKTAKVKGKSYNQGTVYISSKHKDLGRMEVCRYDPRHHTISSNTKYHCGECCEGIRKRSNSTENSGGEPNYCWWTEMATDCPGQHTPMEHHHVHGGIDYETGKSKAPPKEPDGRVATEHQGWAQQGNHQYCS
jgi:hypothetical protein